MAAHEVGCSGFGVRARRRVGGVLVSLAVLGGGLVACADEPIDDTTWQISHLYVEDYPPELPAASAGKAVLVLGSSTFAGNTGCAPFRGKVRYSKDGQRSRPEDATELELSDVQVDDPDCVGQQLFVHEQLERLLPNAFLITRSEHELLLKRADNTMTSPAIRMVK